MRACSMASGGVMFIPDEIERSTHKNKTCGSSMKYEELLDDTSKSSDVTLKQNLSAENLKNAA